MRLDSGEPRKYRSGADAKEAVKILQFVRSEEPKELARIPSWHAGRTNHITMVNETTCVCKRSRPRFGYHNGVGADTVWCSFDFVL